MPWKRFRKLVSHDVTADIVTSCIAPARQTHKVVRVRMKNGVPTGEYDDFLVGFIADDSHAWGRPVGAAVASDGSLLISDDGANLIYRVSYTTGH